MEPIWRFWNLLRIDKKDISKIYLFSFGSGLVALSLPLGIQSIINFIQLGQMSFSWILMVSIVLIGYLIKDILQIFQLKILENIQQKIFVRSVFEFTYRIPRIKNSEIDEVHMPEIVNRFFDTLTIQKGLPKILIDFLLALLNIFFGFILLSFYSGYFVAIFIVLYGGLWILYRLTWSAGLDTSLKESKYKYKLAYWIEEVARTYKTFKLNIHNKFHLEKSNELAGEYVKARQHHFDILLQQYKFTILLKILIAAGLLIAGSIMVFEEKMNIGQFIAAEIVIILVINSVEKLIQSLETIYDVLTALDKIGFITDLHIDEHKGEYPFSPNKAPSIHIEGLSFRFPNDSHYILKDLNASIPSKTVVGIKGSSGRGKTILLNLLSGIDKITEGKILFDDMPISQYKSESLHENIGYYMPSNQLFEGTIADNILLGRKIAWERISEVIDGLNLKESFAELEHGLNTIIDPMGRKLPGNLIRKLLLMRAIIHRPTLLLLEDPIADLYEEEKETILQFLLQDAKESTIVVVIKDKLWESRYNSVLKL